MLGKSPSFFSREKRLSLIADLNASLAVQEPMLAAITLYMSVVYGILYLTFVSYPIIFGEGGHGFTAGPSGLMVRKSAASRLGSLSKRCADLSSSPQFLPLFFGSLLASILSVVYYNPKYVKETGAFNEDPPLSLLAFVHQSADLCSLLFSTSSAAYLPGMAPPELVSSPLPYRSLRFAREARTSLLTRHFSLSFTSIASLSSSGRWTVPRCFCFLAGVHVLPRKFNLSGRVFSSGNEDPS